MPICARSPSCRNSGLTIMPTPRPTLASCALLSRSTEWRPVTWPISWPRTAGQLGLRAQVGHDAAGDVDEAAGQRKGVDDRIVDHLEGPGQVRPLRLCRELLAESRYIALRRLVGVQAERRRDLLIGLAAHLDLLRLADQRQLALAGRRVHRAADDQRRDHGRRRQHAQTRVHSSSIILSLLSRLADARPSARRHSTAVAAAGRPPPPGPPPAPPPQRRQRPRSRSAQRRRAARSRPPAPSSRLTATTTPMTALASLPLTAPVPISCRSLTASSRKTATSGSRTPFSACATMIAGIGRTPLRPKTSPAQQHRQPDRAIAPGALAPSARRPAPPRTGCAPSPPPPAAPSPPRTGRRRAARRPAGLRPSRPAARPGPPASAAKRELALDRRAHHQHAGRDQPAETDRHRQAEAHLAQRPGRAPAPSRETGCTAPPWCRPDPAPGPPSPPAATARRRRATSAARSGPQHARRWPRNATAHDRHQRAQQHAPASAAVEPQQQTGRQRPPPGSGPAAAGRRPAPPRRRRPGCCPPGRRRSRRRSRRAPAAAPRRPRQPPVKRRAEPARGRCPRPGSAERSPPAARHRRRSRRPAPRAAPGRSGCRPRPPWSPCRGR